ncbi:hypothetical protein PM082_003263 [Marasmius tenuissimus]|nr:hypothetical protein PM082_003263 [Marasmius tenuissimus]
MRPRNPAEIADGPMLIGFSVQLFMMGITMAQTHTYMSESRKDPLWMRIFVPLLFLVNMLNTSFLSVYIYTVLIVNFGQFIRSHRFTSMS